MLSALSTADLSAYRDLIQLRHDAFATRGLALDLTRGKPSSDQLDLSNGLLALPGERDHTAADGTNGYAAQVARLAKAGGLALTPPGATHPHGVDPYDRTIRIAPTFPDLAAVATAAEGVAVSVLLAASAALLTSRAPAA